MDPLPCDVLTAPIFIACGRDRFKEEFRMTDKAFHEVLVNSGQAHRRSHSTARRVLSWVRRTSR